MNLLSFQTMSLPVLKECALYCLWK